MPESAMRFLSRLLDRSWPRPKEFRRYTLVRSSNPEYCIMDDFPAVCPTCGAPWEIGLRQTGLSIAHCAACGCDAYEVLEGQAT